MGGAEGGSTFRPKPCRAEVRFGAGTRREGSSAAPDAPADQAITGRPLIGRHPSAHKPAMPFLFAAPPPSRPLLGEAKSPSGLSRLPGNGRGWGESEERRCCGFSSSRRPPQHLRLRGAGLEALPSPPPTPTRGPGGRRPRPRGGRPGARGPTAATQWRPRQAPRAPAAACNSRAGGAGRFQNRPSRWGEGRRTRALELVGPRRVPHTLLGSSIQSSQPPLLTSGPRFGRPGSSRRDRGSTTLTRGRHFLSFLLVLSTSVSLSLSLLAPHCAGAKPATSGATIGPGHGGEGRREEPQISRPSRPQLLS